MTKILVLTVVETQATMGHEPPGIGKAFGIKKKTVGGTRCKQACFLCEV